MRMNWCFLIFAVLPLLADGAGAAPERNNASIRIGWIGPLSGCCAVTGVDSVKALQMVFDEVNARGGIGGQSVELIAEDDRYEVSRSLLAYRKLVDIDRVSAVFVSTYGAVFALSKQAVQDGVILIDPLDCNDDIAALQENTFCLATRTESIAEAYANDIGRKGYKSVFLLYEEEAWFNFIVQAMKRLLENSNVKLVLESVAPNTSDYRSTLMRARSKAAEAIIFLGNDPMGSAMAQARDLGLNAQFYSIGSMTSPGFQALAGASAQGTLVSFWEAPRSAAYRYFEQRFIERYKRKPHLELATIPSYDAAMLLAEALKESVPLAGTVNVESLREQLLLIKSFPGLAGSIDVDADGAVRSIRERLFQYSGNSLVALN